MASIITPEFRVSYPNVFEPKVNKKNGKLEFGLVALFPKGTDLSELKKIAHAVAMEKWPKALPKNLKSPFRDQGERRNEETGAMPAGYEEGAIFINLKSRTTPGLIDAKKQPILKPDEFYAGCWARCSVSVFAYDVDGSKGISIWVNNIQKTREGEPLNGRPKPEDEFSAIASGAATESADSSAISDPFSQSTVG